MNSFCSGATFQPNGTEPTVLNEEKLVAQVAHDLRNVLTALMGTVSLLRDIPHLPPDVVSGLKVVEKAALQARSLSLQLSAKPSTDIAPEPPVVSQPERTGRPEPVSAAAATRILAMDDEPGIRALLSAALSHFGYEA